MLYIFLLAIILLCVAVEKIAALKIVKGNRKINSLYKRTIVIGGKTFYFSKTKTTVALVCALVVLSLLANPLSALLATIPVVMAPEKPLKTDDGRVSWPTMTQWDLTDHYEDGIQARKIPVPMRDYIKEKLGAETVIVTVNSAKLVKNAKLGQFEDVSQDFLDAIKGKQCMDGYTKDGKTTLFYLPAKAPFLAKLGKMGYNLKTKSISKAFKYIKRLYAPHFASLHGEVKGVQYVNVPEAAGGGSGVITEAKAKAIAYKYIKGLTERGLAAKADHVRIPIVGDIVKLTILTTKGFIKGHFLVVRNEAFNPDIIAWEIKDEIKASSKDDEFIGILGYADGKGMVKTDIQSMINFKLEKFIKEWGDIYISDIEEMMSSKNRMRDRLGVYRSLLDDDDEPKFFIMKALLTVAFAFNIPKFMRSVYRFFFDDLMRLSSLRVPIPEWVSCRRYMFPDITSFNKDGEYIEGSGILQEGEVFYSSESKHQVAGYRQPSAKGEFLVLNNVPKDALAPYEGNAIFMPLASLAGASRNLSIVGGGDYDDALVIYFDPEVVDHFVNNIGQVLPEKRKKIFEETKYEQIEITLNRSNFTKHANRTLQVKDQLGLTINTEAVATAMDLDLWDGIDQESIIDAATKEQRAIRGEVSRLVWETWGSLDRIYKYLVPRIPGNVFAEIQVDDKKINHQMTLKYEPEHNRIERVIIYDGQIQNTEYISVEIGMADEAILFLKERVLDIKKRTQIAQHPDNIQFPDDLEDKLYSIEFPGFVKRIAIDFKKTWGGLWKEVEESKDSKSLGENFKYVISKFNHELARRDLTEDDKVMLAGRLFVQQYMELTLDDERIDHIVNGYVNEEKDSHRKDVFGFEAIQYKPYPDSIVWTPDTIEKGHLVDRGMAHYTFMFLEQIGATMSLTPVVTNKQFNFKVDGNVTVYRKQVRVGSIPVGKSNIKNGSYRVDNGIIETKSKNTLKVSVPLVVANGWKGKLNRGEAIPQDVQEWKDYCLKNKGKVVYEETPAKKGGTKTNYAVYVDNSKVGVIVTSDWTYCPSKEFDVTFIDNTDNTLAVKAA